MRFIEGKNVSTFFQQSYAKTFLGIRSYCRGEKMNGDKLKIIAAAALVFGANTLMAKPQNNLKDIDLESLQLMQETGISFEEFDRTMLGRNNDTGNYSAHGISDGNYSAHGISSGNYSAHGISDGNYSAHGISNGNYSAHGVSGVTLDINHAAPNIPSPALSGDLKKI